MKLILKINHQSEELFEQIKQSLPDTRQVKNGIVATLKELGENKWSLGNYRLPSGIDTEILIECSETRDSRGSVIICDRAGKPMRPFYIEKGKGVAHFAVPFCTEIKYTFTGIQVSDLSITKQGDSYLLDRLIIWKGSLDMIEPLPESLERYQAAAAEAIFKFNELQCSTPRFVLLDKEKKCYQ